MKTWGFRLAAVAGAVLLAAAHAHHPFVRAAWAWPDFGRVAPARAALNLVADGALLALAALVLGGWWGAGRRVLRWGTGRPAAGGEAAAFAAGLLAAAAALGALGWAGLLARPVLAGLTGAAVLDGLLQGRVAAVRAWARGGTRASAWPAWCLGPALPWLLAAPRLPVTDVDLLEYHWGLPVLWTMGHRIHHEAGNLLMTMPLGFEHLALPWAAFGLPGGAACAQLLVLAAAAGTLAGACRVAALPRPALAGWLLAGMGAALALAGEGHPDTGLLFAAALGARAAAGGSTVALGLAMGLAGATKYQGVAVAAAMAVGAVAGRRGGLRRFGAATVLAAVAAAPWLVRNALWTGNPVYPFATHVFPSLGWADWNTEALWRSMPMASVDTDAVWPDQRAALLLLAPWHGTATPWFAPHAALLYLLPLLLVLPGVPAAARRWTGQALLFTVIWLLPIPKFGRYLLPALVPATAAWWAVAAGARWAPAAAGALVLAGAAAFTAQARDTRIPPEQVLSGAATPAAWQRAAFGPYADAVAWVNRAGAGRVLVVGQGYGLGLNRPWLANNECGRPAWYAAAGPAADQERMRRALRQRDARWVLYNPVRAYHRHAFALGLTVPDAWFAAWAGVWRTRVELARPPDPQDWTGLWYVYRVTSRAHAAAPLAWLPGAERLLQPEDALRAGRVDHAALGRLNRIMGDFTIAARQRSLAAGIQSSHP